MTSGSDPLLEVLKEASAPCHRCGYDLRGVGERRCPECGAAFGAGDVFGGGRRTDGALLAMLAALAACLPVSWITWQRLLVRGSVFYGDSRFLDQQPGTPHLMLGTGRGIAWWEYALAAGSTAFWLAVPVLMAAVLLGRERVSRLGRWRRWALAGACVVAAVLAYRRWMFWYWWWVQTTDWPPYEVWYLRN